MRKIKLFGKIKLTIFVSLFPFVRLYVARVFTLHVFFAQIAIVVATFMYIPCYVQSPSIVQFFAIFAPFCCTTGCQHSPFSRFFIHIFSSFPFVLLKAFSAHKVDVTVWAVDFLIANALRDRPAEIALIFAPKIKNFL